VAIPDTYESYTTSARRYLFRKERAIVAADPEDVMGPVLRARRLAASGTTLPSDFPSRTKLLAGDVLAVEEVTGASVPELCSLGLSRTEAEAVIAHIEGF
jgi:hypothetical protein